MKAVERLKVSRMEETPQAKGMKPVSGTIMLNFLYWLQTNHSELKNLQSLSLQRLRDLTQKFEDSRPDIEPHSLDEWRNGINRLYAKSAQDDYTEAREFLKKIQ
jgi:hypothetical protein